MAYRQDIDGLRAIAILPVLLYHFRFGILPGGFTGVDIFFVISGFVIAGSLESDIRQSRFSIVDFYFRRFRRLLPAYLLMAALTTVACLFIMLPGDLTDFGDSLMAASGFGANIYFWRTSGYFAATAYAKPLLHMWSLAVEEQFYIFAPFLFYAVHTFGKRRWMLFLAPLLLISLMISIAAVFVAPTAGFFLLPTRAWELLLGALAALVKAPPPGRPWVRQLVSLLGAVLIAFGLIAVHEDDPFPGWLALAPCLGALLIIQAGHGLTNGSQTPWVNRLLSLTPFVWIGRISYSLYLVHWPIVSLYRYATLRDPTLMEGFAMLVASLALATLSWWLVEQPVRHLTARRRTLVLAGGAGSLLIAAAVGGGIVLAHGFPQRTPDFTLKPIGGVELWGGDTCFNQDPARPIRWNAVACTRIHGPRGRILVWGDSQAAQYMPGVIAESSRIRADVLQYTSAGCPPILSYFSYARVGCSASNKRIPAIIQREHITTVVIAARWTAVPSLTIDDLGSTVAALRKLGVKVVVIGQAPEFATDAQTIDYISGQHRQLGGASWPVYFDIRLNDRLRALAKGAAFVDPIEQLCSGASCPYRKGQDFYFLDNDHFSTLGSEVAVRAYFPGAGSTVP